MGLVELRSFCPAKVPRSAFRHLLKRCAARNSANRLSIFKAPLGPVVDFQPNPLLLTGSQRVATITRSHAERDLTVVRVILICVPFRGAMLLAGAS